MVLHAADGPLEASTCGCSHKPFRSLNTGVKGWGLVGGHGVDYRGVCFGGERGSRRTSLEAAPDARSAGVSVLQFK